FSMMNLSDRMEAEGLVNSREMVQMILRDWDWLTWDTLLADNVALSLNLGAAAVDMAGNLAAVGRDLKVTGRDGAKRVLQNIYGDLRSGLLVTTEIVSGSDAVLLGNLALRGADENRGPVSLPVALHLAF